MYTENFPLLQLFTYQLQTLAEANLPEVSDWFKKNSLELDIISPQWFLTLYSQNDNIDLFFRTVDLLFITGTKALFQISLGYLDLLFKRGYLDDFNFRADISHSEILKNAANFKVSNRLLKSLEK
mmetsp:Transcript_4904/g.4157  ORF Transcript_4904/g.4157 Transcript_4904/m.4157 type:complete len:125 (+) Transcript_4904:316-690(+)